MQDELDRSLLRERLIETMAWAFGHLVRSMLFGIEPTDPMGTGIAVTALAATSDDLA